MEAEPGAQSSHTVLTFDVKNITDEAKDLEGRGVSFLDYVSALDPTCPVKSEEPEKGASIADSDGNILCLHERVIGDMDP